MNQPSEVSLDAAPTSPVAEDPETADVVIAFCANRDQAEQLRDTFAARVSRDALTWVAYPKAGQLGTDLNRDRLGKLAFDLGYAAGAADINRRCVVGLTDPTVLTVYSSEGRTGNDPRVRV